MPGRVLTIHLLEGTANGIQTAEIDNWIGKVFLAPRTDLPNMVKQQEIKDALGVYVLVGDSPNQIGKNIVYIGQGNVTNRLTTHSKDTDKEYWDSKMLVIVAKDGSLNTADCLYLESRLIELAIKSGAADVENQTNPTPPFLVATDKTRVDNFLTQIQTLLPVLNINFFTPPPVLLKPPVMSISNEATSQPIVAVGFQSTSPFSTSDGAASTTFTLAVKGILAEAEYTNNQFVVRHGSQASSKDGVLANSYKALRQQYKSSGVLQNDPTTSNLVFTQDTPFNSTSAAAAVICGYSVNGPKSWRVKKTGQTYDAWQQAQLPMVSN